MSLGVLVTGGGGYVGNVLVRELLARGHDVVVMDPMFFGDAPLAGLPGPGRFTLRRKDIRDIAEGDFDGIDAVCDLAALSNDPSAEIAPALTEAINYRGRVGVARAARAAGVARYVLASSCSIYGAADAGRLVETSPKDPVSVYAHAAVKAEAEILPLAGAGFCVTALRLATVFGLSRRMRFDLVVNIMTLHALRRGRITVTGGGRQWRPLVHVGDAARAFRLAVEAPATAVRGEAFNIGHSNFRIGELARLVRETLALDIDIVLAPGEADPRDYNVDFAKARARLGFEARSGVPDGVREIAAALAAGTVTDDARSSTVGWYRALLENGGGPASGPAR